MSQNDFSIADQPGASFLSELNSQIQALATLSSGPTAPTTTYAYQFWYDTTNSLLKIRNSGNSQWITIGNPATDTSVDMYVSNALRARLNATGLGVGVASPAYALDVSGDVNVTGAFRVEGFDIRQVIPGGSKNKIINGNFAINQRGVSGTVNLAAGAFGHDRFKAGASGCTYAFSTTNNVTTLNITSGSLIQVIEGNNLFTGPYTLSWVGTAQGKVGAGSYGASGITASVTGGSNLTIEFNTGTLSLVQFEQGSVTTPFEHRFFGLELFYAQKYCCAITEGTTSDYPAIGQIQNSTLAQVTLYLPVPMRGAVAFSGVVGGFNVWANQTQYNISSFSGGVGSLNFARVQCAITGATPGQACHLRGSGGSGLLLFESEI